MRGIFNGGLFLTGLFFISEECSKSKENSY